MFVRNDVDILHMRNISWRGCEIRFVATEMHKVGIVELHASPRLLVLCNQQKREC